MCPRRRSRGVHAGRTLPCRGCTPWLAAAALAPVRPLRASTARWRATRVGEGPAKVLVVGSIHGNETAGRAVVARLRRMRAARRGRAVAGATRSTRTACGAARARTRAGSTSTATSRAAGAAAGARSTPTSRAGARSPSPSRGPCGGSSGASGRPSPSGTTSTCGWSTSPAAPTGARARLRPPRRAPGAHAAALPRHRDELAEPRVRRHELVRRRAARRPAAAPPRSRRHAAAVLAAGAARGTRAAAAPAAPRIVWRRIPFGATRRAQMRAYAGRHYGTRTATLRARR